MAEMEVGQMRDPIDFTDQTVIVTGAGRGLGRLYALDFARRGAQVVVNDIGSAIDGTGTDTSVADAVVAEIRAAGGSALASHDSVDNPEGATAIVKTAVSTFGRLDAVVSNAGIYGMLPFDELTPEQWRRMLQVHLDGTFYLCQPAFKQMKTQGYGRLVLVASNIGAFGQEQALHYGAAKGGIIGLTNGLANEGAPHGILANAVLPIGRTRMMTDSLGDHEANDVLDRFFAETTAERVVPLVTYLANRTCELSHHYLSAVAGRYARAFIGLGEGWLAERSMEVTAEDIGDHLTAITSTEPFQIPMSVADEIVVVLRQLGIL
jgi:NAD(P)-dependent dehydrogenase (short-subunit alcohol dehydrogenase family)